VTRPANRQIVSAEQTARVRIVCPFVLITRCRDGDNDRTGRNAYKNDIAKQATGQGNVITALGVVACTGVGRNTTGNGVTEWKTGRDTKTDLGKQADGQTVHSPGAGLLSVPFGAANDLGKIVREYARAPIFPAGVVPNPKTQRTSRVRTAFA